MKKLNRNQRHRRGFTLTELAIVLGVMSLILSAIWVAAANVNERNKEQRAQAQITQILTGYRSLFANHNVDTNPTWGDITCTGMKAGYFPADMMPSSYNCSGTPPTPDNYPTSPWGTQVLVRGDSQYNGIEISYYNLTTQACIALANDYANFSGLIQSWVGPSGQGQGPNWIKYAPYGTGTPMKSSDISTFCSQQSTSGYEVSVDIAK